MGGNMEVEFNSSAFEALERDFQEVLSELVGDKSLERFRYRIVQRLHLSKHMPSRVDGLAAKHDKEFVWCEMSHGLISNKHMKHDAHSRGFRSPQPCCLHLLSQRYSSSPPSVQRFNRCFISVIPESDLFLNLSLYYAFDRAKTGVRKTSSGS